MAKRAHTQRFSRPQPGHRGAAARVAAACLLASCATQPPNAGLAIIPYQLTIGRFADDRAPTQRSKDAERPKAFDHQQLLGRLINDLPMSPMVHSRAVVDLHLLDFQSALDQDGKFSLGMTVRLNTYRVTVPGMPIQQITQATLSCRSGLQLNGPDWETPLQQDMDVVHNAWSTRDMWAMSDKNQDTRHWENVFNACVDQLARQYDEALMAPLS